MYEEYSVVCQDSKVKTKQGIENNHILDYLDLKEIPVCLIVEIQ